MKHGDHTHLVFSIYIGWEGMPIFWIEFNLHIVSVLVESVVQYSFQSNKFIPYS